MCRYRSRGLMQTCSKDCHSLTRLGIQASYSILNCLAMSPLSFAVLTIRYESR